jgi:uncharacterized lipoprotein YajG
MKILKATSLILLIILYLGGCAFISGHIETSKLRTAIGTPPEPSRLVNPQFQVQLGEIRDTRRDKKFVGNIRNKLGMKTASITSDPDIGNAIRDVLLAEFRRKGIVFGPSPIILDVDIRKIFIDVVGRNYSDVLAEIEIEVSLSQRESGGLIWSNTYVGKATTGVHQIDRQFLVEVIADAIRETARAIKQDKTVTERLGQYASVSNEPRQTNKEPQEILKGPLVTKASIETSFPAIKSDVDELPLIRTKPNKNAYAIVIGIESYRQKLPRADFAVSDARLVSDYLSKVMGYPEENIVNLINEHANKSDFEKYFEKWLSNNVEKGGTVFVYFSGHGAPNPKTGDAYMVPYDGDPSFIDQTGYPLKKMYEALGKLPAKEIIVALDSCFSGAGGRSVVAKGARPLVMNLHDNMLLSQNITVMSASSGDQISSTYDEKGHGLFTYFMLKGIKNEGVVRPDGSIAISNLFSYLKPQVERIARKQYNNEQSPQLIGSKKN